MGAIVATFHDMLMTLVFLTWFGYDLSLNVIAAILTIAGYSVNDTIVVFDRVRENQRSMRSASRSNEIVNRSVNQTLAARSSRRARRSWPSWRCILFGGEVLRGFAFTMIVGIITGTYSTVFIAAAIAIILSPKPVAGHAVDEAAEARRRARA